MPFRKINGRETDWAKMMCQSKEHKPPMHTYLSPGHYEYTCPDCGASTIIVIPARRF